MQWSNGVIYHSNATDDVLAHVLGDLEDELLTVVLDVEGVENLGEVCAFELDYVPN